MSFSEALIFVKKSKCFFLQVFKWAEKSKFFWEKILKWVDKRRYVSMGIVCKGNYSEYYVRIATLFLLTLHSTSM